MFFNKNIHKTTLYNTLLYLSRNTYFYNKVSLKDTYETRVYLMFIHFSIILFIHKYKKIKFPQNLYDGLFDSIENNLRELGQGDVAVNKKMKEMNKLFYDILLKLNIQKEEKFEINKNLILTYFPELKELNVNKYDFFKRYFEQFYHFCFELSPKNMIKDVLKFKV